MLEKNEIWNGWWKELRNGKVNLFMYLFMYSFNLPVVLVR